jgi:hypothetical protein
LHTILALIFALVVYVMEISEHLERRDAGTGVIHYPLAAMFHQVFKQLEGLWA